MRLNSRQEKIVQFLLEENFVKVESLASMFDVSNETIRRDLLLLEQEAYIKRVHGGAIYDNLRAKEREYEARTQRNFIEKREIAKLAAQYIFNGDTLVMNTGTSTFELARALSDKKNLTVITNSVDVANTLVENESNNIYLAGGNLRKSGHGISGSACCEYIAKFQVDKAILSIGGISEESGITEYHVEESAVMRTMISISNKVMVLSDYSKFNEIALNKICGYGQISMLFTDWNTPLKEIIKCRKHDIKVYSAEKPVKN